MRTGMMHGAAWRRATLLPLLLLFLLFFCDPQSAIAQTPPRPYGEERPPWLVMIGRADPADATRYVGVYGDDQSRAVAFFRGGQRTQVSIPQMLERDDEFETAKDVIAVIRYPIGDVYVDAGTRVRIGSLDVLFGRIFAKVKGFFSVENQNVVAGVEGTEFAFEVARDGSTEITVLDGAVLSSSKKLPWKPLRVTRNQAFWVTNSGMQIKVGAAPSTDLARIRNWVDRADTAVAVLAPREAEPPVTPEPQPPQPVPPSMQPPPQTLEPVPSPPVQTIPPPAIVPPPVIVVPIPPVVTDPSGYCCDTAGQVYPSTAGACRGRLYQFRADALAQCRDRRGFCCANNRVFETIPSQCNGVFSYNQGPVREACTSPPGYCCAGGELSQTTRDRCKGNFYTDATTARRLCAAPPPTGWCCAAGQVLRVDRAQCRGNYYVDEAAARKACTVPRPEQGYCCAGGKVSQTTRDRCAGTFAVSQSEALKACKAVILAPKADTSEIIKKPSSDAAKTKADTSQVIKKPPPPSDGPVVK